MCRRCTPRTTPKTSTVGRRPRRAVVERRPSAAPATCLRDLCSIHSRAWMVHKRFLLFAMPTFIWNAVVFRHPVVIFCSFRFILCLIISPLSSILRNYSCVTVVGNMCVQFPSYFPPPRALSTFVLLHFLFGSKPHNENCFLLLPESFLFSSSQWRHAC